MSEDRDADAKRLRTLERWRAAELEVAQAQFARLAQAATEKESARDQVQSDLIEAQSLAREQLGAAAPLAVDSLRRVAEFTAMKREELVTAQAALEQSCAARDVAHSSMLRHFERLSVVQRLSERRAQQAARDDARLDQKRLDEQALSRLATSRDDVFTVTEES